MKRIILIVLLLLVSFINYSLEAVENGLFYKYDVNNRLIEINSNYQFITKYSYDELGNIIKKDIIDNSIKLNLTDKVICQGSSIDLGTFDVNGKLITITGGSGQYEIKWTEDKKLLNSKTANPTFNDARNTEQFKIKVRDIITDKKITGTVTVIVNESPTVSLPDRQNIKSGESINLGSDLTVRDGKKPYSYHWTDGVNWTSTLSNPNVKPTTTTTYRLIVTDANGCNSKENTIEVRVKPAKDDIPPSLTTKDAEITLKNGTASITENDVIVSKSDNVAIASTKLSKTTFTCDDIGEEEIKIKVTDNSGNSTTKTSSILIIGEIPKPKIAVNPEYPVSGREANTIYLVYGAQSVTLTASGGTTYSWSSSPSGFTSALPSITVTPTETTIYTVTVTNIYGCSAEKSITIRVNDVRGGNDHKKVKVCHNGKEIHVDNDEVASHLAHGDRLGECKGNAKEGIESEETNENVSSSEEEIAVRLKQNYPNPFSQLTEIQYFVSKTERTRLDLIDLNGKVVANLVDKYVNGGWNSFIVNGSGLTAGTYILKLESSGKVAILKVMKTD